MGAKDVKSLAIDPADGTKVYAGTAAGVYSSTDGGTTWQPTALGSPPPPAPIVSLSSTSLTFAGQLVGTTSPAQSVTLTNTGNGALTISSITASGDFSTTGNTCGGSVPPGQACVISIAFFPTAPGSRLGALTIADDATGNPHTVALQGTGTTDFSISASPASQTAKGGKATYGLSLTPLGGFTCAVALSCSGSPSGATCTIAPSSVTLSGTSASSATVNVKTTNGKKGTPTGTFTLTLTGSAGALTRSTTVQLIVQ